MEEPGGEGFIKQAALCSSGTFVEVEICAVVVDTSTSIVPVTDELSSPDSWTRNHDHGSKCVSTIMCCGFIHVLRLKRRHTETVRLLIGRPGCFSPAGF